MVTLSMYNKLFLCLLLWFIKTTSEQGTSTDVKVFLAKKSLMELKYIYRHIEKYLNIQDINIKIPSANREEWLKYIDTLIPLKDPIRDKAKFEETIVIYKDLSVQEILNNNEERAFLIRWAMNADIYSKKKSNTIIIGGIINYANYIPKNELIEYINNTITNFPELSQRSEFDTHILQINFEIPERSYIYFSEQPKNLLVEHIFQFEHIIRNVKKNTTELNYKHDDLFTFEIEKLVRIWFAFGQEYKEYSTYDYYTEMIVYKNTTYINPKLFLNELKTEALTNWVYGCEKYHKKATNTAKSWRKLEQYVQLIPNDKKIKYICQEIEQYPELYQEDRFSDIILNEQYMQYNQVKTLLENSSRSDLIKYYLNILVSIGQEDKIKEIENTLFRMNNNDISNITFSLTTSNAVLQQIDEFLQEAKLYHGDLKSYLKSLPKANIVDISKKIDEYHRKTTKWLTEQEPKRFENLPKDNWTEQILNITEAHNLKNMSSWREAIPSLENIVPLYGSIVDFLKAVNVKYLRTWLRYIEIYIRNIKGYCNIIGGVQEFYNDSYYTKDIIINQIINYINQFPELNLSSPAKFWEVTKMSSSIFGMIESYGMSTLIDYAIKLDGYRRRKSSQLEFNDHIWNCYDDKDYSTTNKNNFVFFIFKILASFPEWMINNPNTFKEIMSQKNQAYPNFFKDWIASELYDIALKFQKFHNRIWEQKDTQDLSTLSKSELELYIERNIEENWDIVSNSVNLGRFIYDEIEMIYHDNYYSFLNRQTRETLEIIYDNCIKYIKSHYNVVITKKESSDINTLIENIMALTAEYSTWKKPEIFDTSIDVLSYSDKNKNELKNQWIKEKRDTLIKYALIVENLHWINGNINQFAKVSKFLYLASQNELIRYVIDGLSKYNFLVLNDLKLYLHNERLDLGESSVRYLTEY